MSEPKRLIIEYEDGSMKGIEFFHLSRLNRLELSKLGLCAPPSAIPSPSKYYLLLRWKDGWQEVFGVDNGSVELLRYYVIERMEEVGRMALEVEGDYPVLLLIRRMPKKLESLTIIGGGGSKVFGLEPKLRNEEGGKVEHVEYDKAERHFQHEPEETAQDRVKAITDTLQREFDKSGLTAEKLLAMDQAPRVEEYKKVARAVGIRATEKQEDVYGFIQLMTENLANSGT
ncbi:MAG: hypothetical protein JSV40_11040 [Deltaproteobacteria bacterium]|nr:MAG: hypothetical protein JSV40_11040 [Deltaproteobacteria bacterium]